MRRSEGCPAVTMQSLYRRRKGSGASEPKVGSDGEKKGRETTREQEARSKSQFEDRTMKQEPVFKAQQAESSDDPTWEG